MTMTFAQLSEFAEDRVFFGWVGGNLCHTYYARDLEHGWFCWEALCD